ncbi:MAG TPA: hypothetical protein VH413_14245 [Verrucomicrobiae bacterium]|jgi:hypothetical protein|nr:hypothetical protein [Verrucomicrobiae bacterium]
MQSPNSPVEKSLSSSSELAFAKFFQRRGEAVGIGVLLLMAVYFLWDSWRKWPDPIVDFGQQCYVVWRVSQGALLYHDFVWSYGPASVFFNATLFQIFGPGIMVLVAANLIIYAAFAVLVYLAFRKAWGKLGAWAALAFFLSIFSFLHLLAVGNYNYATPYSSESTHGMLLILVAVLITAKWCREPSTKLTFALGLCGGMAAVIKPEFMLAAGALGAAGLALRFAQKKPVTVAEFFLLALGVVLPTLFFTVWFARRESWALAITDACQAWLVIFVGHIQSESGQQLSLSGFDHAGTNAWHEISAGAVALLLLAALWSVGWLFNRRRRTIALLISFGAIGFLDSVMKNNRWFSVGKCLPLLITVAFVWMLIRLRREIRDEKRPRESTVMGFLLVLLAGTMLARMPLYARVYHLGFFQAALAGMVVAAMMVSELSHLTGEGWRGRMLTTSLAGLVLASYCVAFAKTSHAIRADQTEPVGEGRDRFYSTSRTIDGTGAVVNWAVEQLRAVPADATVLVLPEGTMINYLSRHRTVEPGWMRGDHEVELLRQMRLKHPDFVVLISRNLEEFGKGRFGTPGNFGYDIWKWVQDNYVVAASLGADPLAEDGHTGATILRQR